jgi:CubicO group peptidase (beta-lactamase class C family)
MNNLIADSPVLRARQVVADFRSANPVPGVSVAVFDSAHIIFEQSEGVRAVERPEEAMTADTVFRLYSLTKMITALAVARLADAGRLGLDDLVATFFPASVCLSAPMQKVTIRQLLSHTSGLPRGEIDLNYGSLDPAGLSQHVLESGVNETFVASPGETYSYSDEAFAIVGYVIERSTGLSFGAAMRELVFGPLGMDRACFDPLIAMTLPVSQQHVYRPTRGLVILPRFADSARIRPYCGAFCSTRDLCQFGMLHLGDGIAPCSMKSIISPEAIREMRNPVTSIGLDIDLAYGLGAYVGPRYGGAISYGHEGYYVGSWTKLVLCPGASLGLVWCDNRGPSDALNAARLRSIRELLAIFGAGEPSWAPAGPEPTAGVDHAEAVGWFRGPAGGAVRVQESAGQLRISDGGCDAPLVRHRGSVFVTPDHVALPDRTPWKPHAGSDRCCVCFVRGHDGSVSYVSFNGIAYRRQEGTG